MSKQWRERREEGQMEWHMLSEDAGVRNGSCWQKRTLFSSE